ncbi:MAG TPA: hypothetical protein VGF67_27995 [Ktedonobacteraceae bacterium]|jgi:hypothetical protein
MCERNQALHLFQPLCDHAESGQALMIAMPESAAVVERVEVRAESNLELVDSFVQSSRERADFLHTLATIYALTFQEKGAPFPAVVSFTSRKGVLSDPTGEAYFVKQKPRYAQVPGCLFAALFSQCVLSEYLPHVLRTREEHSYAHLHNATYFLTPLFPALTIEAAGNSHMPWESCMQLPCTCFFPIKWLPIFGPPRPPGSAASTPSRTFWALNST